MNAATVKKLLGLLLPPEEPGTSVDVDDRSVYERFAIPYTFKPRLSLFEAVIATFGALLRIFLGSLLFAVWGTYALLAWGAIHNYFLRLVVLAPMVILFVVMMVLLMAGIAVLGRMFNRKPTQT